MRIAKESQNKAKLVKQQSNVQGQDYGNIIKERKIERRQLRDTLNQKKRELKQKRKRDRRHAPLSSKLASPDQQFNNIQTPNQPDHEVSSNNVQITLATAYERKKCPKSQEIAQIANKVCQGMTQTKISQPTKPVLSSEKSSEESKALVKQIVQGQKKRTRTRAQKKDFDQQLINECSYPVTTESPQTTTLKTEDKDQSVPQETAVDSQGTKETQANESQEIEPLSFGCKTTYAYTHFQPDAEKRESWEVSSNELRLESIKYKLAFNKLGLAGIQLKFSGSWTEWIETDAARDQQWKARELKIGRKQSVEAIAMKIHLNRIYGIRLHMKDQDFIQDGKWEAETSKLPGIDKSEWVKSEIPSGMQVVGVECAILQTDYTIPRLRFKLEEIQKSENQLKTNGSCSN